jgi:hypothetical protein
MGIYWLWRGRSFEGAKIMLRILAIAALGLSLAGCVYAGPGPSGGYYGGAYGWGASGYPGPPSGERAATPG